MLLFLLHSRTAWNDHFPETDPTTFNSTLFTSRQTPSGTNIYVSNCLFRSISSSSGHGGALYCSNSGICFLIESSSFFSCKTSNGNGGAIYFVIGQSVLHEVCGYDCYTTHTSPYFQFAHIQVNSGASNKNHFNYSSVARCVNGASSSWDLVSLQYGNVCSPSVNISLNKCYGQLIDSRYTSDSSSVACSFSYSSFADNNAISYGCFLLWTTGANYEIKSCNILRNTQDDLGTQGTISTIGNLMIEDSCILENKANNIFHQSNSNYRITISNCTVDSISNNGYLTIQNTVTKSFILALNHMSTENCHSKYDSAGTLTPPSSKKQIHCSCEIFLYHCPQGDFFSSTFVLIFNFIHLYSSSDPL
jgi:hypothetical protein